MTEHYYSKNPQTKSEPRKWSYVLRGEKFNFNTDSGVFSKGEVDFGSKLLIESFEMPSINGEVLDVGCGYGPIGLTIAKVYPDRFVHMIDVNSRAVQLSNLNAQGNNITNVRIYESDGLSNVEVNTFAAILTNPPIRAGKSTVFKFYDEAYSKLVLGGELWVVIQKKQGAPSTITHLKEIFGQVETVEKKKGYYILKAKKH